MIISCGADVPGNGLMDAHIWVRGRLVVGGVYVTACLSTMSREQ